MVSGRNFSEVGEFSSRKSSPIRFVISTKFAGNDEAAQTKATETLARPSLHLNEPDFTFSIPEPLVSVRCLLLSSGFDLPRSVPDGPPFPKASLRSGRRLSLLIPIRSEAEGRCVSSSFLRSSLLPFAYVPQP